MNLYFVNTYLKAVPQPVRLVFKAEERARQFIAHPIGHDGLFTFSDDFGTELHLEERPIARVLVNLHEQLEAEIELGLAQTKAQMKAQKRAQQDSTMNGGSSLWNPASGGGPVLPFPPRS